MMKYFVSGICLSLAIAVPAADLVKPEAAKHAVKAKSAKPAGHTAAESGAMALAILSPEQMAIADKVLVGKIHCELAVVVTMTPDAHSPGRFLLEMGHKRYTMDPVVSSTGAVRLEEEASGAVWLQLGNKSMLMNQKEGKRLADDCMNPDQLLVAQALERNPVPGLLDAPKDALVPIGAGASVQELVPNPAKTRSKKKSK